jgi:hypothetical protein
MTLNMVSDLLEEDLPQLEGEKHSRLLITFVFETKKRLRYYCTVIKNTAA